MSILRRSRPEKYRQAEIEAATAHASLIKDGVDVDGHGCWNWLGKVNKSGYGYLTYGGMTLPAHRLSYIALVGPFAPGLVVDHLCENKVCINPEHLEPVTIQENLRRYHDARRARAAALA